ncbi:MAG: MFS transporter [Planctomycetes bacterium]|nr:MFS transporter [Planctomycetota bacterium]
MDPGVDDLERTLRRYPVYQALRGLLFWQPMFLLFFAARVRPDEALLLVAAYDLAAVLLEVPSGYLADAVGRRFTLLLSALTAALGAGVIALGDGLPALLAGQALLGAAAAFNSGSDAALLWETLAAAGREGEFAARDAAARRLLLVGLGASALTGGFLAGVDDRLPYLLTALAAGGALAAAAGLREPPRARAVERPLGQALGVARAARDPVLLWVLVLWVGLTVLNHVPYAFLQPYLQAVLRPLAVNAATPAVAGVVIAATMLLGGLFLPLGVTLLRRLGGPATLLLALVAQGALVAAMALGPHPAIVALLALRMVPEAVASPVLGAVVHPRLDAGLRATYLSAQSLLGMLAFSGSLALAAAAVRGEADLDAPALARVLPAYVAGGAALALLLAATARPIARRLAPGSASVRLDHAV